MSLISPRRIGKTGLILNAFYRIREADKNAICIYIDIFATKNQHDFVQLLGTAVAQHVLSHQQKAQTINIKSKHQPMKKIIFSYNLLTC
jgi:Ni2+-binding GTPase involved in maturation of urease and hydrogenase